MQESQKPPVQTRRLQVSFMFVTSQVSMPAASGFIHVNKQYYTEENIKTYATLFTIQLHIEYK